MAILRDDIGHFIARMPFIQPELDKGAEKVKDKAIVLAAVHVDTGEYISSFEISPIRGKKGVIDRAVYNTDPAAVHIEFGAPGKNIGAQHILYEAADRGKRNRRSN